MLHYQNSQPTSWRRLARERQGQRLRHHVEDSARWAVWGVGLVAWGVAMVLYAIAMVVVAGAL